VVKTRIQTQVNPSVRSGVKPAPEHRVVLPQVQKKTQTNPTLKQQTRSISTSSPSTHTPRPGSMNLHTSSIITGLKLLYKTEGIGGWFRGVGPRFVWTSVQSGCMLFLYQSILRQLEGSSSSSGLDSVV
jgi:hypothetical protein